MDSESPRSLDGGSIFSEPFVMKHKHGYNTRVSYAPLDEARCSWGL